MTQQTPELVLESDPGAQANLLPRRPPRAGKVVHRFAREPGAVLGVLWIVTVATLAAFAPLVVSHGPNAQDLAHPFAGWSGTHWLGTDDLGRDVFARLVYGARISLRVSFEVVGLALVVAIPLGVVAGYVGGAVDYLLMRLVDIGLSFPALVLALAVVSVLGGGVNNACYAIAVVMAPSLARVIRGQTLAVREEAFIEASRSIGSRPLAIMVRRIFPNVLSPLVIQVVLAMGGALLAEASLSFLGLGEQPPTPSWGSMLNEAYNTSLFTHPWAIVIPGAAIAATVLAYNAIGDGLAAAVNGSSRPRRRALRQRIREMSGPAHGLTPVEASPPARSTASDSHAAGGDCLEVSRLSVSVGLDGDTAVAVVEDVSLRVSAGEVVGLVGESGSGKSVTSLAIMRLLPAWTFRITSGSITASGRDLLKLNLKQMCKVRGGQVAMVFQDPMTSLNPAQTVGAQIAEAARLHLPLSKSAAAQRAVDLLERVGIADPAGRARSYPHELSGGMRQRVMIAIALAGEPRFLIADEPTTALDVTVQAQILELLLDLSKREGLGILLVTHDLGVVNEACDRVAVMYAGQIVETGETSVVFAIPQHPYTAGLLAASREVGADEDLAAIPGQVPTAGEQPTGCRFHPRCEFAVDQCRTDDQLLTIAAERSVRCIRASDLTLKGVR